MKRCTLKQLLNWTGLLGIEMGLAAPAISGDQSQTSQRLFIWSVILFCTVGGGFIGAAIGHAFKDPLLSIIFAAILAIAGFIFGGVAGWVMGMAFFGWSPGIG